MFCFAAETPGWEMACSGWGCLNLGSRLTTVIKDPIKVMGGVGVLTPGSPGGIPKPAHSIWPFNLPPSQSIGSAVPRHPSQLPSPIPRIVAANEK